ncbi:MAG: AEC family transporter [Erysipelotrichaceae bacterium]|nr:AEC family transporter [Erysipelotrichaceae bacterium]
MEYALIVSRQLLVMFAYMAIGFAFYKARLLNKAGTAAMSNILVYAVIPSIILHTFFIPYDAAVLEKMAQGLLAALISLGAGAIICILVFKDDPLNRVGCTFPNAGFIGIPLVTAVLGAEAIVYLMPLHMMLNVFQYTYAATTLSKERNSFFKVIIKNPMVISVLVGLAIFLCGMGDRMPSTVSKVVDGLYGMLTPLSMIVAGTYLAQVDFRRISYLRDLKASFTRLILIPVCFFLLMKLVPIAADAKLVVQIGSACSIGSVIAIYADKFDNDYVYACEVVTFSTIMLALTMPLIMMFLV